MVTRTKKSIYSLCIYILTALILTAGTALHAQDQHAYKVQVKLSIGGRPIIGFLHSVTDTTVTILNGIGGPKALKRAITNQELITIPTKHIKHLLTSRVRPLGHYLLSTVAVMTAYTVTYLALIPVETFGELVLLYVVVGTASIFTGIHIYWRKHRPTDLGFTMKMQKYSLASAGMVPNEL
jgi:hypothetical protein